MTCPSTEQLTTVALGLADDATSHIAQCADCQTKLADLRQVSHELAAAHATLDRGHVESRTALLSKLSFVELPPKPTTAWRRFAFGGIGLSSAIAALLLLGIFANSTNQLAAMERIVNAVRDVKSFSYKLRNDSEFPPSKDKPARTLVGDTFTYWQAPPTAEPDQFGDFRGAQTHEWVYHHPTGDQGPTVTMDLVEIHPSGRRGIMIDYVAKKYYRMPALHAGDIAGSTPLLWLRAVREKAGRLVEDLGARRIGGRDARGYVMTFDDAEQFEDFGPVEVWIDPQTDLPMEFSFEYAKPEDGLTDRYTVTDIQWNADLDPKLFDTTAPQGYLDITIPTDEKSVAEIIDALKLYAELSGGRYPHVEKLDDRQFTTKFDAEACYHEMLDLAGFAGPERDEWASDSTYQRIQQSRAGLDTLERILQSYKWLVGYDGSVGPDDNDQVLLWWNIALDYKGDQYRLFYGDLRTEIVPGDTWVQFMPPEIAEFHQ